jgi:glycosyltransferase involved in cell wall biosynthesis
MTFAACAVLAVLSALYAVVVGAAVIRLVRGVPLLERLAPAAPKRWPKVSVIVAACNEQDSIEAAMRSRLVESYPNAEYILVDDRSTDRTGAIIDQLAAEDDRVRAVHVRELPDGWLGKVHAMEVGLGHATGEWILFSDADVHHEADALSRIVAHCEGEGIDHMTVFPTVFRGAFTFNVVMNAFIRMFAAGSRAWSVPDPRSRVSVGGGNFNLVRRTALEHVGGLAPLRMEVVEDVALGQMLKWSGAKAGIVNARGFVGLAYYTSILEALRGMEKNCFAALGRFSVLRFVVLVGALVVADFGGLGVLCAGSGWPRILSAATLVVALANHLVVARWLRRPLLPSLLAPLGLVVLYVGAFRAMILALVRGGIDWRGTRYSLAALRRGMRYVQV